MAGGLDYLVDSHLLWERQGSLVDMTFWRLGLVKMLSRQSELSRDQNFRSEAVLLS